MFLKAGQRAASVGCAPPIDPGDETDEDKLQPRTSESYQESVDELIQSIKTVPDNDHVTQYTQHVTQYTQHVIHLMTELQTVLKGTGAITGTIPDDTTTERHRDALTGLISRWRIQLEQLKNHETSANINEVNLALSLILEFIADPPTDADIKVKRAMFLENTYDFVQQQGGMNTDY